MAASPSWKVYFEKEYRGATKHVEDAACLVAFIGNGAEIRFEHSLVVWTEGQESQSASESYDHVAEVAYARRDAKMAEAKARRLATR